MTETAEQPAQKEKENPLAEGLALRRTPDPCALVIFGASGDLTHKKLMPALYALAVRRLLPPRFAIVGVARTEGDDDVPAGHAGCGEAARARPVREETWDELAAGSSTTSRPTSRTRAARTRCTTCSASSTRTEQLGGNRVFYLAVPPPASVPTIVEALGKRRDDRGWTRLVVEKPFGHDLESAKQLTATLLEYFREEEIFRIDHYLGKETVQNMLALRFANGIFEPIWNRQFIDHVQITVAESIGIEARAGYYEHAGAIRDIFQNHLLQLLALTAMEPPIDFTSDSVHNEKVKVLRALRTPGPKAVVRGQYGPGFVEGEEVVAYREEAGVAPDSMTETYVAAKLYVDNWRWADTPFYVRMGKRLRGTRRRSRSSSRRPASAVRGDRGRGAASERARRPRTAGRGRLARDRREGARPGDVDPHRPHGLPLRRRLPHGDAGGVRAPDPRHDARRLDAVHARRRGRGAVAARRLDRCRVAARPTRVPELSRGVVGPPSADELLHRDGRVATA